MNSRTIRIRLPVGLMSDIVDTYALVGAGGAEHACLPSECEETADDGSANGRRARS